MDERTVRRIVDMRKRQRRSLREIAESVGLSRERVRQVLIERGVSPQQPSPENNRKKRLQLTEEQLRQRYGCTSEELDHIQGNRIMEDRASPVGLYRTQRNRSLWLKRGWAFTLPTWWALWKAHWPNRNRGNLVMVPLNTAQPIGPGNAQIITRSEVMKQWHARK
ncbi:sigma factor-like helix-turn-helix DNA-binding protein [Pseudoxanthomonas kaohsiungensis]|uniref:Sigma factor-like helix-turn-helix DNA-binding protein n=1 Tax=Pseudoxanthomonas kaohsiungensis TaxID=283923 RepID=A0ABW3LQQ6_9GAMM